MVRQFIHLLLVAAACVLAISCHRDRPFVIEGEVKDGGSGTVYLYRYGYKNFRLVDSVPYANGNFHYTGKTSQPLLYGISVRKDDAAPQSFFIGEDTLRLGFWKTGKEVLTQDSPLNDAYLSMRERAPGASESAILRYVHDHSDSPVTAFFVLHDWSWRLDLSTLELVAQALRPSLNDCLYLQQIQELIEHMKQVQPGRPCPPVKGVPASGGKWTVLAFFATWCPDCRAEMPRLADVARQHPGVQWVGFSLDTQAVPLNAFKAAHQGLFHTILTDYQGWDSPVVRTYAVRWIPTFFLISPAGKIVKSVSRADAIFLAPRKFSEAQEKFSEAQEN